VNHPGRAKSGKNEDLRTVWRQRQPERSLLWGAFICIAVGFLTVLSGFEATRPITLLDAVPLAVYGASLLIIHLSLTLARFRGDQPLLGVLLLLAGVGVLMQFRLGVLQFDKPLALTNYAFPAGVLALLATILACKHGRYRYLATWPWAWGVLSLLLIGALLLTGQRFRGAIYAAGLITPTELLKVSVILFLAGLIDRNRKVLAQWRGPLPPLRALLPLLIFWAMLAGLLLWQRDLGMFVILSIALVAMLTLATGQIGYVIYAMITAGGLGYLALRYLAYGQRRILAWQDPLQDPTGFGWQILQGLSGMYAGGLWGTGLGRGDPENTPIAAADFVYAALGEEAGFSGCLLLAMAFLALFYRAFQITLQTRSSYGALLCGGLSTVLATQTLLNLGGVTKTVPLTGITLPFISHGGSSLLTSLIGAGLILAVSDGEPPASKRPRAAVAKKITPRRSVDNAPTKPAKPAKPAKVAVPKKSNRAQKRLN